VITTWYLRLIDIATPARPLLKGTWGEIPTPPVYGFDVADGYAYLTGGNNADELGLYAVKVNLQQGAH
jgi:hypothetical protein